jgi:hypothetical protein
MNFSYRSYSDRTSFDCREDEEPNIASMSRVCLNETRLAYVTICTLPSNQSIPILARLYTVGVAGGKPREIDAVRFQRQDTLSIAPPVRCIVCGAG